MDLYTPYASLLRARGLPGRRIRKVTVNGGFTCPNIDGSKARGGCTYCDNRSFSPAAGSRGRSITRQLEEGTAFLRERLRADAFIAYFQTYSGTYAPAARLRALYEEALSFPGVVGIAVGTRPDCLEDETLDLLEELARGSYVTLELGLQSAFDETLRRVNRAHGFREFADAMDRCQGRGFGICVHVILGMPGEGPPHYRETAAALGRWRYDSIKIHPLHVVKGTALARQFARGEFLPLELEAYVAGLVDFLERVPPEVGVQRFTGDAGADLLLAPAWCSGKSAVLEAMKAEFRRRGTRQGHWVEAKRSRETAGAAEAAEAFPAEPVHAAPGSEA
jgi:radical SAM protein (TIGR01212 family)